MITPEDFNAQNRRILELGRQKEEEVNNATAKLLEACGWSRPNRRDTLFGVELWEKHLPDNRTLVADSTMAMHIELMNILNEEGLDEGEP